MPSTRTSASTILNKYPLHPKGITETDIFYTENKLLNETDFLRKYDLTIKVSLAIEKLQANIDIFQQQGLGSPVWLISQVLMAWWCNESQLQQ